eukprot:73369_1
MFAFLTAITTYTIETSIGPLNTSIPKVMQIILTLIHISLAIIDLNLIYSVYWSITTYELVITNRDIYIFMEVILIYIIILIWTLLFSSHVLSSMFRWNARIVDIFFLIILSYTSHYISLNIIPQILDTTDVQILLVSLYLSFVLFCFTLALITLICVFLDLKFIYSNVTFFRLFCYLIGGIFEQWLTLRGNIKSNYHSSSVLYHSQYICIQLLIIYGINYIFKYYILLTITNYKLIILYFMFIGICFMILLNIIHVLRDLINRDLYNYIYYDYWCARHKGNIYDIYQLTNDYKYFSEMRAYYVDQRIQNKECIICWKDFNFEINNIQLIRCGHLFHGNCIQQNENIRFNNAYRIDRMYYKYKRYPHSKCPTCNCRYDINIEKWNYDKEYWNNTNVWFNDYWPEYGQTLMYKYLWQQRDKNYNVMRDWVRKENKIRFI